MMNSERLDFKPILPFLPPEPGLRAHLFRVGALAARAAHFNGYPEVAIRDLAWAGLLHHYKAEPFDTPVPVALLRDLGLENAGGFAAPPARAAAIVRAFRRIDAAADEAAMTAASLLESANLFDEQMENLPYEDLTTERAVAELLDSGVIAEPFARALDSFRTVTRQQLSGALLRLPPISVWDGGEDLAKLEEGVHRYFDAANGGALWPHSLEVAREMSRISGLTSPEAFCAGLVHDIGRLAYLQPFAAQEVKDWESIGFPASYAEFLVSGMDHADLGAEILAQRGFAPGIVDAAKFHHRPELTDSRLAAAIYAFEEVDEALPSCSRDNLVAKRIDLTEIPRSRAHGN
jgi:putative nucleotidyltransferase with HDIG domain